MELSEIQRRVTHFSLELPTKAVQQQEVIVGGEITTVIPPADQVEPMYILLLDDQLGMNSVFISGRLYDEYADRFVIGHYVFLEGYVHITKRMKHKELHQEVTVYAYALNETTEKEVAL